METKDKRPVKTLQAERTVSVAEIVRHGEKLTLPENMKLDQAIDLLKRRKEYEQEETRFTESYECFPLDGANALNEVLIAKFGWAPATATPGFFGSTPPQLMSVEVAPGVFKKVPWGRFSLPNIEGYVETGVSRKNNRYVFSMSAEILRMDEDVVKALFAEVREYLKTNSIYQGRAIKIRFRNDNGNPMAMPEPSFIDTSKIDVDSLIYAADVQANIETNLFTPIRRVKECAANGIPTKRGVLLGGTYGTGKTLAATVASRYATDAGITYVYIPRADELPDAIEFAKQYNSPACVIFCEDIDRVTAGERSIEMDDILNLLDGIDTKNANIITVLTTNDLESINPAMLRPGRLDAVIDVTPPDAQAAEKLVRLYGGASVDASEDLTEVGQTLNGMIPAVIAEVVKRAKLAQLRLQAPGEKVVMIKAEALLIAAKSIASQVQLLAKLSNVDKTVATVDSVMREMVRDVVKPMVDAIELDN